MTIYIIKTPGGGDGAANIDDLKELLGEEWGLAPESIEIRSQPNENIEKGGTVSAAFIHGWDDRG